MLSRVGSLVSLGRRLLVLALLLFRPDAVNRLFRPLRFLHQVSGTPSKALGPPQVLGRRSGWRPITVRPHSI